MRNGGTGLPRGSVSARGRAALAAAALVAAMLLPGIGPAQAEVTFTFDGGGYGHSVGMSQYGAYGMAREGYTWQEILSHYFTGATPAAADPGLLAEPIWVGLVQDQSRLELKVVTTGTAPAAPAAVALGANTLTVGQGETVVIEALGGSRCRATAPAGSLEGPCSIDIEWDGWTEEPTAAIQLGACVLPNWNAPGGTAWQPCRYARGTLHVRPDNDSSAVHLSVEIGIEDYILGISESPYAWGTTGGQAALEAQAVAARSYALHRALVRGDPAARPWCWCQLYDTTVDQFYAGWGHGTQTWVDAVAATAGQVMVHPSVSLNGELIPIQTFYSSSSFGWTENSEDGFTAYVPYLRAVDDHWGILPAVGNPYARWTRSFTASRLASLLPGLSTVTGAEATRCSQTGAILEITFTGGGAQRAVSTRELRGLLGLPSMQIIDVGTPADGSPACHGFAVAPEEREGGIALAGVAVDDDGVEDSAGNGDGLAQCGEKVELVTTITADGVPLHTVNAALSSPDPYVSVLWNSTSAFPDLAAGASGANLNDWDLAISADAPASHTAHLTLRVSAADAGPWDLDVPLPITCAAPAAEEPAAILAGVVTSPGDVNGDGTPDVAVALAREEGPARFRVIDGATGRALASLNLARAGYVPIAATAVPSFTGSAAAEVAVLLTGPDRPARVVVVDAAAGTKARAFGLARTSTYYDIAALLSPGGSATPRIAVLTLKSNGVVRVVLRDAATGAPAGGVGFGRSLAPAALAPLPDTGGGAAVAVLGNAPAGELRVQVRRVADRALLQSLTLAPDLTARDLVAVAGTGAGRMLVAAGRSSATGAVRVITADPLTGAIVASGTVAQLASADDLEALGQVGGGPGADVALLGRAADGAPAAATLDPAIGAAVSLVRFAGGYPVADITVLGAGRDLAALGIAPSGEARLMIHRAATGSEVGSFAIL